MSHHNYLEFLVNYYSYYSVLLEVSCTCYVPQFIPDKSQVIINSLTRSTQVV